MLTQHEVANVETAQLKRLAVMYGDIWREGGPLAGFAYRVAQGLVHVIRERRRLELLAEAELMNDDDEGELVPESNGGAGV
jgi:hypothetical protein